MVSESNGSLDEITCPICLHDTLDAVRGPCGHEFCLPCLERLLLSPPHSALSSLSDTVVAAPTLGSCPMCRQELYLFDIESVRTGEKVHHRSQDGALPEELAGAIFVESTEEHPGMIGRGSYHFPRQNSEDNNNSNDAPYYDISEIPRWSRNNYSNDRILFVDHHWHAASRTFAGILPFSQSRLFDHSHVIMSFSPDWRFVRQGVVLKRRRRDSHSANEIQLAYPFDGVWKVIQSTMEDLFPVGKSLTVQGFCVEETLTTEPCLILPPSQNAEASSSRPKLVSLATMKEFGSSASIHNDLDLSTETIPVGYEWKWVDGENADCYMIWKRETVATTVPPDESNPLGGSSGRLLVRSAENEQDTFLAAQLQHRVPPQYNAHGLWGNVFCQAMQVGLASYHFEQAPSDQQPARAYISYESAKTARWPPLDNGQAIPPRVPFHNVSFDAQSRTFCGHICWQEDFGTTWSGMIRWEYEMVFDRDFTCILSGQVNSFNVRNVDEGICMSRYGESLVYCNACLWQVFRDEATAQTEASNESYRARSDSLRAELAEQGASVRTIAMLHSLLTAARDPQGQNLINYDF